jgi:hypothetical protein
MTDLITLPRATVQQALEAWEHINLYGFVLADYEGPMEQAITALKAALEQPEQEPVAWTTMPDADDWMFVSGTEKPPLPGEWRPLYTHPLRREPLSDEELDRLWREPMSADWEHREYARAVEAAHGIKEKLKELNT